MILDLLLKLNKLHCVLGFLFMLSLFRQLMKDIP